MRHVVVKKDSYYDSVFLMLASSELKRLEGFRDVVVAMATPHNRSLLGQMGYGGEELQDAGPNDLVIAVEGDRDDLATMAEEAFRVLIQRKQSLTATDEYRPVTLHYALEASPNSTMIIISVPGQHAAREAESALVHDLHVMLFSDNVPIEDEVRLKKLAARRGLLLMGPDCGTAIINGKPLCFANVLRRGSIGIVGASGTGIQEVACCIHRRGGGISQAIGTGGRDLSLEVGGIMTKMGIEALERDPSTKVMVVISKPPDPTVGEAVISMLRDCDTPSVVHFIGRPYEGNGGVVRGAPTLAETAEVACQLSGLVGEPESLSNLVQMADVEVAKMASGQRFLRGLYAGGTLCEEALFLLGSDRWEIRSNVHRQGVLRLSDVGLSQGNTLLDLGDDVFTVGRPHPMIDPSLRGERLLKEVQDPEVGAVLFDVVLGYGSHSDPAGELATSVRQARDVVDRRGGHLACIASIVGTEEDPQDLHRQRSCLEEAGVIVMPDHRQAALLARELLRRLTRR